jgi:hypothetical protein
LVYSLDRVLVFRPERSLVGTPEHVGLEYEDAELTASDGPRLHGWWLPGRGPVSVLWCHGNGGNVSTQLGAARVMVKTVGANVLLFDYRGYGRSEGKPTERGTYRDARAALAYVRSRPEVDPQRLVYFGRSLGAGVAAELARTERPAALVLESPFPGILRAATALRRRAWLAGLMTWALLRARYDTAKHVRDVHAPVLVAHGDADEQIPLSLGREVYEAANEPKQWFQIAGGGHNDTFEVGGPAYHRVLAEFIERHAGG